MGEEDDREKTGLPALKFPLLPRVSVVVDDMEYSPEEHEHPSTTSLIASVPFKWEEQPGKPRPCTDIIIPLPIPAAKPLELPPCRSTKKTTLLNSSPTTVIDGPYLNATTRHSMSKFSSFRFFRRDSFDSNTSSSYSGTPESATAGESCKKVKVEGNKKKNKIRRNGSFSTTTTANTTSTSHHHRLWVAAMYQGLKQVIPWKSGRKSKNEDQA